MTSRASSVKGHTSGHKTAQEPSATVPWVFGRWASCEPQGLGLEPGSSPRVMGSPRPCPTWLSGKYVICLQSILVEKGVAELYRLHAMPALADGDFGVAENLAWIPRLLCEAYSRFATARLSENLWLGAKQYVAQKREYRMKY